MSDHVETLGFTAKQTADVVGALADLSIAYHENGYNEDLDPDLRAERIARVDRAAKHLDQLSRIHRLAADLARARAEASR